MSDLADWMAEFYREKWAEPPETTGRFEPGDMVEIIEHRSPERGQIGTVAGEDDRIPGLLWVLLDGEDRHVPAWPADLMISRASHGEAF